MVTSSLDNGDNANPLDGSLRKAILDSNGAADPSGPNLILFALPDTSPIAPTAALPAITRPVTVDGRVSQTGGPAVTLDGSNATPTGSPAAVGLDVEAGDSVIEGLAVVNFAGSGIALGGPGGVLVADDHIGVGTDGQTLGGNGLDGITVTSPNNTIGAANVVSGDVVQTFLANVITNNGRLDQAGDGIRIVGPGAGRSLILGNEIGIDSSGNNSLGNGNSNDGVLIDGAPANTIGGTSAATRNVISFNGIGADNPNNEDGVEIRGLGASGNQVEGNYIGLDLQGSSSSQSNANNGVQIVGAPSNTIRGNVISGNGGSGVELDDQAATGNVVAGNLIGIDSAGTATVNNSGEGVDLNGAPGNTIGGTTPADRNVISGNSLSGILLRVNPDTKSLASGNLILNNYIGTDEKGDSRLGFGNAFSGITIDDVPNNTVGGLNAGNVIGNNAAHGIRILNPGATGNTILGNLIGLDATGESRLANFIDGINIAASGNTVGGTASGARNVVSGNGGDGIAIQPSSSSNVPVVGNLIEGNYIGLDARGVVGFGNTGGEGVRLQGSSFNTIGGTTEAARNVISSNNLRGVLIQPSGAIDSDSNLVAGNYIGTDVSGSLSLANISSGVGIFDGSHNTIGGTVEGARNVIAFNGTQGIEISGATIFAPNNPGLAIGNRSTGNLIQGNFIGTDPNGAVSNPNGSDGITINTSIDNTIGGTTASARNVIYDNFGDGINLSIGSNNNLVQGNFVGTGAHGEKGVGNHGSGVFVYNSSGNTIGGTAAGAGNVISNNQVSGVDITRRSVGNLVQGNHIGIDAGGLAAVPNGLDGVVIEDGSTNNTVGGLAGPASRNIISGNTGNGVALIPASGQPVTGNVVVGNDIGTDASGTSTLGSDGKSLGNLSNGVLINASSRNTVAGNLISGNGLLGVNITGAGASANRVFADLIGTDFSGSRGVDGLGHSLGNRGGGLSIIDAPGNTIGGSTPGSGDLISNNAGIGLQISGAGASGNVVQGSLIGTDLRGALALGNTQIGLQIFDSGGNVIGGLEPGAGNLISGNHSVGLEVLGSTNGASGNAILGNRIGGDATSTRVADPAGKSLGNTGAGLLIQQAGGEFVFRNTILGNAGPGVDLEGGGRSLLASNLIGTGTGGETSLGNLGDGVHIAGSAGNTVGGLTPVSRNVISGNLGDGLGLSGASTTGNVIFGDSIGVDGSGRLAVGNRLDGVRLSGVGAGNDVSGDIISGNAGAGVEITGTSAESPTVQGNLVGTDASGLASVPNAVGVYVHDNAGSITIGGTTAPARNVISGNGTGVVILQVSTLGGGVAVQGNFIGTDARGSGVPSSSPQATGVFIDNATRNVVGGTAQGAGNVISGNRTAGVQIFGQAGTDDVMNLVQGNVIGGFLGVLPSSRAPASSTPDPSNPAQGAGVVINTSAGNVVGGAAPGAGNLIVDDLVGVEVVGVTTPTSVVPNNTIQGNLLDYDAIGVFLNNSASNLVGGPLAAQGNEIAHNSLQGITIFGPQSSANVVQKNRIVSNTLAGIYVNGSVNNTIGGAVDNEISGNGAAKSRNGVGVYLFNGALGNVVARNRVRSNTAYGVFLYNSAGNIGGVVRVGPSRNTFGGNRIADFREFTEKPGSKPTKSVSVSVSVSASSPSPAPILPGETKADRRSSG